MPPVPSKISKRNDTGEFVRGQATDANGAVDLRGKSCRFLGQIVVNNVQTLIDSDADDGVVIVEEDESGDVGDRGWWRFEPSAAGVDVEGLFECELEVIIDPGPPVRKLTWPSAKEDNPYWQIDPDIA